MDDDDGLVRTFEVLNPLRHDKGFTVYKVVYKSTSRICSSYHKETITWKRYSDFRKLYYSLHRIYLKYPSEFQEPFPPFAKAKLFGRFDSSVVEERRQTAFALLNFAAKYPILHSSITFTEFFTNGAMQQSDLEPERLWQIRSPATSSLEDDELAQVFTGSRDGSLTDPESPESRRSAEACVPTADTPSTAQRQSRPATLDIGLLKVEPTWLTPSPLTPSSGVFPATRPMIGAHPLLGSCADLCHYKVIGMAATNVLAVDQRTNECCVIKALRLADAGSNPGPTVLPMGIPNMATVKCIIESDMAVYLVMEFVKGGKLWDHLDPWWEKDDRGVASQDAISATGENLYAGKRLSMGDQVTADLHPPGEPSWAESGSSGGTPAGPTLLVTSTEGAPSDLRDDIGGIVSGYVSLVHDGSASFTGSESSLPGELVDVAELSQHAAADLDLGPEPSPDPSPVFDESMPLPSSLRGSSPSMFALDEGDAAADLQARGRLMSQISSEEGPKWRLSETLLRRWIRQIVNAVHALHRQGIVLRDLKPDNLLLDESGNVKLTYFCWIKGTEHTLDPKAVEQGFVAPEVVNGITTKHRPDSACDWWSLGAILCRMVTKKSLHSGSFNPVPSFGCTTSPSFQSLIEVLLRADPRHRLNGHHLLAHPFFHSTETAPASSAGNNDGAR